MISSSVAEDRTVCICQGKLVLWLARITHYHSYISVTIRIFGFVYLVAW